MSNLVELTVELVEPYIPHLVRVLGSYDPTYREAARDALTRLVERGVQNSKILLTPSSSHHPGLPNIGTSFRTRLVYIDV